MTMMTEEPRPISILVATLTGDLAKELLAFPDLVVRKVPLTLTAVELSELRTDFDALVVDADFTDLIAIGAHLGYATVAVGAERSGELTEGIMLAAYTKGADGWVPRPVELAALRALLRAILRRFDHPPSEIAAEYGPLRLTRARQVLAGGTPGVGLSNQQARITRALLKAEGGVVPLAELGRTCTGGNEILDMDSLHVAIHGLRRRFAGANIPARIVNEIGTGYKLELIA